MNVVGIILTLGIMAVATATAVSVYDSEHRKVTLQGDLLDLSIEAQNAYLESCGSISTAITLTSNDWKSNIAIDFGERSNWSIVLDTHGASLVFNSNTPSMVQYVAARTGGSVVGSSVEIEVQTPDFSDLPSLLDFKYFSQGLDHCNS